MAATRLRTTSELVHREPAQGKETEYTSELGLSKEYLVDIQVFVLHSRLTQ